MVGLQRPDLLCRHFIVSDDFYFRIDLSDELIEVIGKTVIIVDQQNHTDPLLTFKIHSYSRTPCVPAAPRLRAEHFPHGKAAIRPVFKRVIITPPLISKEP